MSCDFLFFGVVEPILFAVLQFPYGLGIHLPVVDGTFHTGLSFHLYAQVATRAGRVGEGVAVVGGGDERAESLRHGVLVAAHFSYLYVFFGEQSFDFGLFAFSLAVIFVDVHQPHASQHSFYLFGIVEFDVVHVVFAEGVGQNVLAEC